MESWFDLAKPSKVIYLQKLSAFKSYLPAGEHVYVSCVSVVWRVKLSLEKTFKDIFTSYQFFRIPIELFPTATQDRLQESRAEEKYINTSTFRRFQPTTTKTTTTSTASTVSTTTEVSIEEDRARWDKNF